MSLSRQSQFVEPDAKLRALLQRVDVLTDNDLAQSRPNFNSHAALAVSHFARGGNFGGSAHREHMHTLCARELHERGSLLLMKFMDTHRSMSASPADPYRTASKDWIAQRLHAEIATFEPFLWKPREAFGETGAPDTLDAEAKGEIARLNSEIDNLFDALLRNRVERGLRWAARIAGWFRR